MELSNKVYHYKFDTSEISIFKTDDIYIIKYIQNIEHDNKIKSKYHFKIISETSNENVKTTIMKVCTKWNPKPETIYRIYSSDVTVKTALFKFNNEIYEGNGSFYIKNKCDYYVIFKNIDNELSIPTIIENVIFYYDLVEKLWIGSKNTKIYKIDIIEY